MQRKTDGQMFTRREAVDASSSVLGESLYSPLNCLVMMLMMMMLIRLLHSKEDMQRVKKMLRNSVTPSFLCLSPSPVAIYNI